MTQEQLYSFLNRPDYTTLLIGIFVAALLGAAFFFIQNARLKQKSNQIQLKGKKRAGKAKSTGELDKLINQIAENIDKEKSFNNKIGKSDSLGLSISNALIEPLRDGNSSNLFTLVIALAATGFIFATNFPIQGIAVALPLAISVLCCGLILMNLYRITSDTAIYEDAYNLTAPLLTNYENAESFLDAVKRTQANMVPGTRVYNLCRDYVQRVTQLGVTTDAAIDMMARRFKGINAAQQFFTIVKETENKGSEYKASLTGLPSSIAGLLSMQRYLKGQATGAGLAWIFFSIGSNLYALFKFNNAEVVMDFKLSATWMVYQTLCFALALTGLFVVYVTRVRKPEKWGATDGK